MEFEHVEKQTNITLTSSDIMSHAKKISNWKAPGPDHVQGFWFKNLTSIHSRLANQLNQCLETANTPEWMGKGKTTLI